MRSPSKNLDLADLENNPHAILHELRTTQPVVWVPALNCWLVTRRDLVIDAMRDAVTYTVDHPGFSTAQVVGPSMLSLDGAEHLRHRTPFERPFRLEAVQNNYTSPVQAHIEGLLTELAPHGHAELRRAFAGPVAVKTMITALGLEAVPVAVVLRWYDTIVDAVTRVTAGEPVSAEGRAAFAALKASLLPALRGQPEASLLAMARSMANGLSDEQIVSNAAVLLFGGIETTEGMIANALYHLLLQPAMMEKVLVEPALLPAVSEESLRLEPAAAVLDRYATRPVELGGAHIQAGDLVRLSLSAANRDSGTFPEPDTFNPLRPNLRSHVTFAQGPHVCLGLHLARLETQLALAECLRRLPNLRLADPAAVEDAQPRGLVFRKPKALLVVWG